MNKELCKPCAVSLAERGKTVKPIAGRSAKITCAECGRRKFGITYEVTGRARRCVTVDAERDGIGRELNQ